MDYRPRLIELDFVATLEGFFLLYVYVCTYACSYTFFSLAMPTTDYCVDHICGCMLVRGFTYLSFLLLLYTFIIIMMVKKKVITS